MKIELDLPQVPEGWRCIGLVEPRRGHGYISERLKFVMAEKNLSFNSITFERIEPVDHELECDYEWLDEGER